MNNQFEGRSFLKEIDYTPTELAYLIDFASHLKTLKAHHIPHPYLQGKNIALLFEKTSTRTRSAFTVAANDLGANPEFLGKDDIQFGTVEDLATYSGVPVWNGLTDEWHPTQILADFLTLKEHFGHLKGLTLAYVGDGRNNMANSLLVAGAMLGINIAIGAPVALQPAPAVVALAQQYAQAAGSTVVITADPQQAVTQADALYTDVWVSMGEQVDYGERIKQLLPFQINTALLAATGKSSTIVMHCLPALHDLKTQLGAKLGEQYGMTAFEITDDVFQSKQAVVFEEAGNRMPAIKAVMAATLGNLFIPTSIFN